MLTSTVRELICNRRKPVVRNPICTKPYSEFVGEKINQEIQAELRQNSVENFLLRINQIVVDRTFRFVVWDYGTFFSVQIFENDENYCEDCVIQGKEDNNYSHDENYYILPPMQRKKFRTLKGVESYILWYYNSFVMYEYKATRLNENSIKDAAERIYEIKTVQHDNIEYKQSRAIIFTIEMMVEWERSKLLPTLKQLVNGKRYNRSSHSAKIISALNAGRIIKQDNHYIVYWR